MTKLIPLLLLLITLFGTVNPVAGREPERGNFVPADLDTVGHPYVEQLVRQPTYHRGRLLERKKDDWLISVRIKSKLKTVRIDKTALDLDAKLLRPGTPIVIQQSPDTPERWLFITYNRIYRYSLLIGAALIFCMLIGGWPTTRGLIGLGVGGVYFFFFLIPRIQAGWPIILEVILFYLLISVLVLPAALGFNRKALSAILATLATGATGLVILYLTVNLLSISGLSEELVLALDYARRYFPDRLADLNFSNLVVGGALIGILGVVLDVTVDITSATAEISSRRPDLPFQELLSRSTTVSRRLLGTMCHTLLLAYLGSDLILLFSLYILPEPIRYNLNRELISIALVRGLGGALGFIFAVPLAIGCYTLLFRPPPRKPRPPGDPGDIVPE